MAVAAEFGGDLLVGRVVRPGGAQHDAAAQGQCLGSGTGADKAVESAAPLDIQFKDRGEGARHGSPSGEPEMVVTLRSMMPTAPPLG
jgi:hypothetical protein